MRSHENWSTPGFALPPVAHHVGPFSGAGFLRAIAEHPPIVVETDDALVVLERRGGVVTMPGHEDLVDYRTPLGPGVPSLVQSYVGSLEPGELLSFDSLPLEAAEAIVKGLSAAGFHTSPVPHASVAVLSLPSTYEGYLALIGKKERHETRRKRRRFEEAKGTSSILEEDSPGVIFEKFLALHRRSRGVKGSFMTAEREQLFRTLMGLDGWAVKALVDGDGAVASAVFGYADEGGYYLYNSAYDPDLEAISPGMVLLSGLIEQAIVAERTRFDFLKGDERYKFRFGAKLRRLFSVEVRL